MSTQTKNTLAAILQHGVTILCGLILPRAILTRFGSEMNGLVHAATQFLSYTVLIEFGIGAVIPAALYQPLAAGDGAAVSAILRSGRRVYRRIALVETVYLLLLMALFPLITGSGVSRGFTVLLLLGIGLGSVASYLAGTPERLLLISDQKGYVVYLTGTVFTLLNAAAQLALIRAGRSLALVKLSGSVLTILQILVICRYVKTHYAPESAPSPGEDPIPRKWEGTAQHVAYFVLENTDIILLTLFAPLQEVSVYSVYFMVVSGVRRVFTTVTYSVQPRLGELRAKGDQAALNRFFASFETWIHISTVLAFGCLALLLEPFVRAYTAGVTDAQYSRPVFALLMTLAYGCQSLRDPYDKLILASGHFRQTRNNYIVAAAMNLLISLLAVRRWGLEGVAAGTLAAMVYQLAYMALYDSRALLGRSLGVFLRRIGIDALIALCFWLTARFAALPAYEFFTRFLRLFRGA